VGPDYRFLGTRTGWPFGALVVAARLDGELAEEFACGRVDHADVQVLDEQHTVGSGVSPAHADGAQAAVDAQGDATGLVNLVVAEAVVGLGGAVGAGCGLWAGGVGGRRLRPGTAP
jgi:hypothetical protein